MTKKWIKLVAKLRKKSPNMCVARTPLLWVLDTEKTIERKRPSICPSIRLWTLLAPKPYERFPPKWIFLGRSASNLKVNALRF